MLKSFTNVRPIFVNALSVWLSVCLAVWLSGCLAVWLSGCLAVWLSGCLAVWLSGCLAVWLSGCLAVWLSGCLAVWLSGCLAVWLSGCLAVWLSGCLAVWLSGCLAVWLSGCLAVWLSGCLAVWLSGCLAVCLSGCLAVWLSGCLAVWLSGCLAVWLSGCLAVWLSGCLAVWLSGCLAVWLSGCLAVWLSGCLAVWLSGCLAVWLSGCLAVWLSGCLAVWLSGCLAVWLSGCLAVWLSGCLAVWLSGCLAVWLSGCLAVWLSGCLAVWLSGCLAVWLSGCLAVWLSGCLAVCLAVWLSGCLAVWLSGCLAVWLSGCLAVWLSGCLAVWLSGCLAVHASTMPASDKCHDVLIYPSINYSKLFFLSFQFLSVSFKTTSHRQIIEQILEMAKLQKHEKQLKYSLALVLVYECLFGRGLKCGGKFKQIVTRNKSSLNAALARLKIKAKVTRSIDLLPKKLITAALIPRYARVNLLLTSMDDVLEYLGNEGYMIQTSPEKQQKGEKTFYIDPHIPDVLVFPPATDLHNHHLYNKGHIILQDKASCLPAHILNPPPGSHVIDACAAPGNKTSHLASHMKNEGKIFAFDIDNRRLTVMKKLMHTAGVKCLTMKNMSFLKVDPNAKEYQDIEYIVVDPSCSGSGIVNRMDSLTDEPGVLMSVSAQAELLEQRLESLSQFQLSAVVHALSFPAVKKVVYSTCSVHQKENEDVVFQALKKYDGVFELTHIMDSWTNRGLPVFPGAEKCIRATPDANKTNGFFVALFKRKDSDTSKTETIGETDSIS
ncbi:hypothetical protein QZH41_019899 [Actinostola sp. cb2023]|nr:hypothetical protein QZH41_019899 [Actinostola sp. cb2023]